MTFRNQVISERQVRRCRDCNAEIFWLQNKNSRWFAVNVLRDPRFDGPFYKHHGGAHNNLTPWHKCAPKRDFWGERLVSQAQRCAQKIARAALDAYRANPDWENDPLQLRLVAILGKHDQRIQRRLDRLPEASKPYVR